MHSSRLPRLLVMIGIYALGARRRILANMLVIRLLSIQENDHATARQNSQAPNAPQAVCIYHAFRRSVSVFTQPIEKESLMAVRQNIYERITTSRGRPLPRRKKLPPSLQLKSMTPRTLARWYLRGFSIRYHYLSCVRLRHIPGGSQGPRSEEINTLETGYELCRMQQQASLNLVFRSNLIMIG